jgi:2'-5' RNA ligase
MPPGGEPCRVYSVNVPVPSDVARLAASLASRCPTATRRERHTLLAKRLPDEDARQLARRARDALAGTPPFALRVDHVGLFRHPVAGPGPVAYLAVKSPGLERAHARLCEEFGAVEDLEGDDYTPHVTVARGGDADRLRDVDVEPSEWEATRLEVWDPQRELDVESISLPA